MTAIIDLSGIARTTSRVGAAIVSTVKPLANGIEIITATTTAWTEEHAANLLEKTKRNEAVREIVAADLMRKAKAKATQGTIATNQYVRNTQEIMMMDSVEERIHTARMETIGSIDADVIAKLASKDNLTLADIQRAAKVGTTPVVDEKIGRAHV